MNEDLKQIKKKYGEAMSHLCRELFPTLLEKEGLLPKLLLEHFYESHALCEDIVKNDLIGDFKNYIYSLIDIKNVKKEENVKTPEELLDSIGYNLYECKTEEDIQSFKKYYIKKEELCTFHGGRLNSCRVFFAVKKNVEEIKREDFLNPKRQDLYGTSVISIQFDKDKTNRLSIKNRYNHTVSNPDSTFSNNLDNIVEGLTDSFEKHYGIIQRYKNNQFEIPNYVMANDGKFYKYNYEIDNIYYCPNNVIIDSHGAYRYDKEKYLVFDYFILDLVNKKIKCDCSCDDCFTDCFGTIQKIEIKNQDDVKMIIITNTENNTSFITLDKENRIIGLSNEYLKEVGNLFLVFNKTLKKIDLPKVEKIGTHFLHENTSLTYICLPNVLEIDDSFLRYNNTLIRMELPNVLRIGNCFLDDNNSLISVNLPSVEEIGNNFLCGNSILTRIDLPKVEKIGTCFLYENSSLKELYLPKVKKIASSFLYLNNVLTHIDLPSVEEIGNDFLFENNTMKTIDFPNIVKIGCDFLFSNQILLQINMPKLETIQDRFLPYNVILKTFYAPNLQMKNIDYSFLHNHPRKNTIIKSIRKQKEQSNKVKKLTRGHVYE